MSPSTAHHLYVIHNANDVEMARCVAFGRITVSVVVSRNTFTLQSVKPTGHHRAGKGG